MELFPFQKTGVSFLAERERALLASDPGLGKTVMLLRGAQSIWEEAGRPDTFNVLVLCPKSLVLNWEKEARKWVPELADKITCTNWDKLSIEKLRTPLIKKWDLVIGDESHVCLKNHQAKKCKFFCGVLGTMVKRIWLATATPASTSAADYWVTLYLLYDSKPPYGLGAFKKKFCKNVPDRFAYGGVRYEGFRNLDEIRELFRGKVLRHRKEVVMPELPQKTYQNIPVKVAKGIVAEHLEIDVEAVIECIDKGKPLPGHLAHVMQATAEGKIPSDVDWLVNSFQEGESVVVFAWHRSVVNSVAKELGEGCAVITGEVSAIERDRIVTEFQEGKIKRLVMNMQAGGVGLTLTRASTCVYVEFPFSPTHLVQSEARIHRIGTERPVNIVRFVGERTIDEEIFSKLDERVKAVESVGV